MEYRIRWCNSTEAEDEWFAREELMEDPDVEQLVLKYETHHVFELQVLLGFQTGTDAHKQADSNGRDDDDDDERDEDNEDDEDDSEDGKDDDNEDGEDEDDEEDGGSDVQAIVAHHVQDGVLLMKVRWVGTGPEDDEWFPRDTLQAAGGNASALVAAYSAMHCI
jgi:hypothetical protein